MASEVEGGYRCCQLPAELLANVLRRVEQQQRVTSCALVCRSWRGVAAAVTTDISICPYASDKDQSKSAAEPQQLLQPQASLQAWLAKHGRTVHSIEVNEAWNERLSYELALLALARPALQLPCHHLGQLQRLTVSGMQLQPDPAAAAAAAAMAKGSVSARVIRSSTQHARSSSSSQPAQPLLCQLRSLIQLSLSRCDVLGWAGSMAGLSLLTQLQHLELRSLRVFDSSNKDIPAAQMHAQLATVLPHLTALTHLSLEQYAMQAPPLQHLKQLQELLLQDCRVSNKVLAQLPASLRVFAVAIERTSELLPRLIFNSSNTARLRQLSSLQGLHLPGVGLYDEAGLLATLSQLTSLTLDGSFWEERAVPKAPVHGLTSLLELCFVRMPVKELELLQDLPPSLTRLELTWLGAVVPDPDVPGHMYGPEMKSVDVLDVEAAPSIAQLTALRRLHLLCAHLEDTNTEALRICPSLVQQLQQLQDLRLSHIAGDSPTMLLDALQSMQQMQHLELHFSSDIYPLEDEEMQQYAALTASSQLTCLKLLDDHDGVAYGAAKYMFAAGTHLPKLKQLHLGSYAIRWAADIEPLKPFGEGDIARLAAACPALEHFQAIGAIQRAADISSLAQLTTVTQIVIGGCEVDGPQLAAALLQLQQLRELEITGTSSFGAADLVRLTCLTNLRRLAVDACETLPGVLEEIFLAPKVSPAATISVSAQLHRLCMQAAAQSPLHQEEED